MDGFHVQILTIQGMRGQRSVREVTHALGEMPGVRIDSVEVGRARVLAEPECEPLLREALAGAGFTLAEAHTEARAEGI